MYTKYVGLSLPLKWRYKMKKNMGTVDRIVRLTLAGVVLVLCLTGVISGTDAVILGALAVVWVVTSLLGFCPLYLPFKISTRRE